MAPLDGPQDSWERETELVSAYQQRPSPETAAPLISSLQPYLRTVESRVYKPGLRVPRPVIQGMVMTTALDYLKRNFKPDAGTKPVTYLEHKNWFTNRIRGTVNQYSNILRIPGDPASMIGRLREAEEELSERLGRPPSDSDLAEELGQTVSQVRNIRFHARQKDYVQSRSEIVTGEGISVTPVEQLNVSEALLRNVYADLAPQERAVYDMVRRQVPLATIARKMKMSRTELQRVRDRIGQVMQDHQQRIF